MTIMYQSVMLQHNMLATLTARTHYMLPILRYMAYTNLFQILSECWGKMREKEVKLVFLKTS